MIAFYVFCCGASVSRGAAKVLQPATAADDSSYGPYTVAHGTLACDGVPTPQPNTDEHGKILDVFYPSEATGELFPVVTYTHGAGKAFTSAGTPIYSSMWHLFASWGFVVLASRACYSSTFNNGSLELAPFSALNCAAQPTTPLPKSPCVQKCFGRFYELHYDMIHCSRTALAASKFPIDAEAGVIVAGHSMGAEAALFAAAFARPEYHISAAAIQHYCTSGGDHDLNVLSGPLYQMYQPPVPRVPTILFTGTQDAEITIRTSTNFESGDAHANETINIFTRAATSGLPRGLVNKLNATHEEPLEGSFNPRLGYYSVAWSKLYQNFSGRPRPPAMLTASVDWDALIFGRGSAAVCAGGDGALTECVMDRGSAQE